MTATPKQIVPAADLSNVATLLYTSPATGKGTWIDKATALNHSGAARTVTFNIVPAAGAAGTSNLVVSAKSIADKTCDLLPELVGQFLPPGTMVYGNADTGAGVALTVSGRELT